MKALHLIINTIVVCLCILIVFWMLGGLFNKFHFPQIVVTKTIVKDAPNCNLETMFLGQQIKYKGKDFTIETLQYYKYGYLGDEVKFELKENKSN